MYQNHPCSKMFSNAEVHTRVINVSIVNIQKFRTILEHPLELELQNFITNSIRVHKIKKNQSGLDVASSWFGDQFLKITAKSILRCAISLKKSESTLRKMLYRHPTLVPFISSFVEHCMNSCFMFDFESLVKWWTPIFAMNYSFIYFKNKV